MQIVHQESLQGMDRDWRERGEKKKENKEEERGRKEREREDGAAEVRGRG